MPNTFVTDNARRETLVNVALSGLHDAIGREKDRSREEFEFCLLLPPGVSKVADKIMVLVEFWIRQCRQHLSVRVNVYSAFFCLANKCGQINQVVSCYQNAFPRDQFGPGLYQFWNATYSAIIVVEYFCYLEINFTQVHQLVQSGCHGCAMLEVVKDVEKLL